MIIKSIWLAELEKTHDVRGVNSRMLLQALPVLYSETPLTAASAWLMVLHVVRINACIGLTSLNIKPQISQTLISVVRGNSISVLRLLVTKHRRDP